MPRLTPTDEEQVFTVPGTGNFQFSAVRMENLGATEYSLITIVVDRSASTADFEDSLIKMVKAVIEACRLNPRAENLLIRLLKFNERIDEIHGFKLLSSINTDDYEALQSDGYTALYDATYDAVGATLSFAETLDSKDYDVNGAVYIITDGMNNRGTMTPHSIKEKIEEALKKEAIESLLAILVGLNDPNSRWNKEISDHLETFKEDAGLDAFIEMNDVSPKELAKLGNFMSQSISSTSQNLGKGVKSQKLTF